MLGLPHQPRRVVLNRKRTTRAGAAMGSEVSRTCRRMVLFAASCRTRARPIELHHLMESAGQAHGTARTDRGARRSPPKRPARLGTGRQRPLPVRPSESLSWRKPCLSPIRNDQAGNSSGCQSRIHEGHSTIFQDSEHRVRPLGKSLISTAIRSLGTTAPSDEYGRRETPRP